MTKWQSETAIVLFLADTGRCDGGKENLTTTRKGTWDEGPRRALGMVSKVDWSEEPDSEHGRVRHDRMRHYGSRNRSRPLQADCPKLCTWLSHSLKKCMATGMVWEQGFQEDQGRRSVRNVGRSFVRCAPPQRTICLGDEDIHYGG